MIVQPVIGKNVTKKCHNVIQCLTENFSLFKDVYSTIKPDIDKVGSKTDINLFIGLTLVKVLTVNDMNSTVVGNLVFPNYKEPLYLFG